MPTSTVAEESKPKLITIDYLLEVETPHTGTTVIGLANNGRKISTFIPFSERSERYSPPVELEATEGYGTLNPNVLLPSGSFDSKKEELGTVVEKLLDEASDPLLVLAPSRKGFLASALATVAVGVPTGVLVLIQSFFSSVDFGKVYGSMALAALTFFGATSYYSLRSLHGGIAYRHPKFVKGLIAHCREAGLVKPSYGS
ncbi:MAG: hypothetical protein V1702_06200 [Candidatus Woesearchaeota archaeon]